MDNELCTTDLIKLIADLEKEVAREGGPNWRKVHLKGQELMILAGVALEREEFGPPRKPWERRSLVKN